MDHQISVDVVSMLFSALSYLAIAGALWIFLRLFQACFWLPSHLKKKNNMEKMLQDKVESYERYVLDCENKEKEELAKENETEGEIEEKASTTKKWKERRECLEMLKRELKNVQEGTNSYDWDQLLKEEEALLKEIEEEAEEERKRTKATDDEKPDEGIIIKEEHNDTDKPIENDSQSNKKDD